MEGRRLSIRERADRLALHITSPTVCVGWSLGGEFLIDFAHHYPECVSGLVLLGTNPSFVASGNWPGMDAAVFHRFVDQYQENPSKTMQRFASLQVSGSHDPRARLRCVKSYLEEASPLLGELLLELTIDRRLPLGSLRCPVLHLLADHDELVPNALSRHLNTEFVEAASHVMFLDQPTKCAALISTWLQHEGVLEAC